MDTNTESNTITNDTVVAVTNVTVNAVVDTQKRKRGRPALSAEEKAKRAAERASKKTTGKRGRPALSAEEKAKRAVERAEGALATAQRNVEKAKAAFAALQEPAKVG